MDGAVSLWGTLFSILGGLLIGLTMGDPVMGCVYGLIGSTIDSVLGEFLQAESNEFNWLLNSLVNTLSGVQYHLNPRLPNNHH